MSAPTPAPGDDRPREGYYPDPSIPGYVRYWNGAAWVPGTSRPAPKDGESLAPPPGVTPAVEETGPHFFDEEPGGPAASGPAVTGNSAQEPGGSGAARPWPAVDGAGAPGRAGVPGQGGHAGGSGQPAGTAGQLGSPGQGGAGVPGQQAGQAGASGQAGEWGGRPGQGGQWDRGAAGQQAGPADPRQASVPAQAGAPWGADPRVPAEGPVRPDGRAERADGTATIPPAERDAPDPGTFVFRRPVTGRTDDGTMTMRPVPPKQADVPGFHAQGPVAAPTPASPPPAAPTVPAPAPVTPVVPAPAPVTPAAPAPGPGFGAVQPPQDRGPAPAPQVPQQGGPAGGSWAQQVHQLAGGAAQEQPVAPWKPPVEDVFQAAARRQAAARPAGLGKRLAARLIDTVVVGAVTALAAVPLGTRALDHIQQKVDAARQSGHEVTVWLLDGTTGTSLGIVLAVLLVLGVAYEVLPTVKWGRTLGKKLCGLDVRDIEGHEPPAFAPALRRWLVYSVPGLLGIGIVGVLWCLFDRPWHQCWHDKAAHTFVAG
ncbi:RDD family protein [Streptomyces sp. WP-1]|uniref:RDD family protein n=1 Tax=Streptomyces sp. WP-1 TaxID=3041497 RepID=UPI002648BEF7|nr:RDD family protein [Streptomyces sp. WP-1]WKE71452.1 RDD family protein [Streptomyces sp. WP-1]